MNSISHAKVSRIFKPVLVPSTVEGTRQEVEGIPSEQASNPLNHSIPQAVEIFRKLQYWHKEIPVLPPSH